MSEDDQPDKIPVADTLGDVDDPPHACTGCGEAFETVGDLLDHDCDGAGFDDFDDSNGGGDHRVAADGGRGRIDTAAEFLEWSFEIRGEDCLVVTNDISTDDDRPDRAAIWAAESVEIPEGVVVEQQYDAPGTAPAVRDRDVEGWTKYELRLAEPVRADGGTEYGRDIEEFDPDGRDRPPMDALEAAAPDDEVAAVRFVPPEVARRFLSLAPHQGRVLFEIGATIEAGDGPVHDYDVREAYEARHGGACDTDWFDFQVARLADNGFVATTTRANGHTEVDLTEDARRILANHAHYQAQYVGGDDDA